jgi:hypothetical protein
MRCLLVLAAEHDEYYTPARGLQEEEQSNHWAKSVFGCPFAAAL